MMPDISTLSGSELLFYGGIAVIALSVVLGLVSIIIFMHTGRKIHEKLEREYGKPGDYNIKASGRH